MIRTTRIVLSILLLFSVANLSRAESIEPKGVDQAGYIWEQETLTNGLFGLCDHLAEHDVEIALGVTNIYQQNVRGGLSTSRRAGRYTGSYDLEISANLQNLLGIECGSLYTHIEGGWPDTEGIDGTSVGSAFGVNADAIGDHPMDVAELFYEGPLFDENLTLMIGKIDFTWVFDITAYADDETSQFLNAALVDDPTIPFPDYSLGVVVSANLAESLYLMGGMADAQAQRDTAGFTTAFDGKSYYFYILETGVTPELDLANGPMPGAYRVGLWGDPQPKAHADAGATYRNDVGFYISCDQMLTRESSDVQDCQGLGMFLRYGYADSKRNDIANFWSVGFQYQGLVEGRDNDVLGVGFAQGIFSNKASSTYTDDHENAFEFYYSTQFTPWASISPSIQYITNPGGDRALSDALVMGVRAQMIF